MKMQHELMKIQHELMKIQHELMKMQHELMKIQHELIHTVVREARGLRSALIIEEESTVREAGVVRLGRLEVRRPAIAVDERGEPPRAAAPNNHLRGGGERPQRVGQQGLDGGVEDERAAVVDRDRRVLAGRGGHGGGGVVAGETVAVAVPSPGSTCA